MTNDEINIAIAEACGLDTEPVTNPKKAWSLNEANIPSYTTDLNAMHEAEKLIKDTRRGQYNAEISLIAAKRNLSSAVREPQFIFDCIHATASQRAEAFLRTIGKWKE